MRTCAASTMLSIPSRSITFTGSKAHNITMRKRALARGLTLNEYALTGPNGPIACKTEADLFGALGLAEIPPELREDHGEFDLAEKGGLPVLIEPGDLTGTFHCHSDWSDGSATLAEMARSRSVRGHGVSGIADHSRAGGLCRWSDHRARARAVGGDRHAQSDLQRRVSVIQGHGVRYPGRWLARLSDELLDGFEYVVASVHSLFSQPRDEMTRRLVRAASNPRVTMLGHPTGRLLLARDGYQVDLDAVIDAARPSRHVDRNQRQSASAGPRRDALPPRPPEGCDDRHQS